MIEILNIPQKRYTIIITARFLLYFIIFLFVLYILMNRDFYPYLNILALREKIEKEHLFIN